MLDYYLVEHIIYTYILPAVCIPGVLMASLCVFIFARQRQTSLEVLLCGLSVFDVLVLLCTLLIYPAMRSCASQENPQDAFVCHFFWKSALITFPLSVLAQAGSVWTCVAVTLDRFIAVSYPIRKRVWCTPATSFAVLMGVTTFSIIFKIPAFFEIGLNEHGALMETDLRNNDTYKLVYMTYLYTFIIVIVPWTIIILLNAIVIHKVRQAYRVQANLTSCVRRGPSRREDGERKVTVMALVMTGVFILCNTPPTVCNMIESFLPDLRASFRPVIPLSNLLVCVNSATNVLIYCVFNRKFRCSLIEIFKGNRAQKRKLNKQYNGSLKQRSSELPSRLSNARLSLLEYSTV